MKRGSSAIHSEKSADGRSSALDRASDKRSMSIKIPSERKRSGTNREWKFKDASDEPAVIPESWASAGIHEDGAERFYAVEVRIGTRYEFTVDHTGESIEGPHRDEPGIETLYVAADGGRAIVIETGARHAADGVVPCEDWASVLADPVPEASSVAPERRDAYRSLIEDLYGQEDES